MKTKDYSWSLRRRLTVRVLTLVLGGWLATIAISAWVLDHEMNEMFDEELRALVETTVLFLDTSRASVVARNIGVATNDGERVLRIVPMAVLGTGREPPAPWPGLAGDGFHATGDWRILRATAEGAVIEAAHAFSWRREEMLEAASAFFVLALPLAGLLLWGIRSATAETMAPVTALARSVAARRPDDLSPVAATDLPRELRPLSGAFDSYLTRIGAARTAERDFIANAAHELRTPLAAIRARMELSGDPDAAATVPMIDALTRRVERLLQLSRLEAGVGIGGGPADVVQVLRLLIADMRTDDRQAIRFDDSDLESLAVAADPDALAILLRNILENAVEHGSGTVALRLSGDGTLTVENPTTATDLSTTRFEKGEGSAGLGLGLSIIAALARAIGATLDKEIGEGRVRLTLRLPLAA